MPTSAPTQSPHPSPRLAAPLLVTLAACSGGVEPVAIVARAPVEAIVDVDFGLRVDLRMGHALAGDARHADLNGDGVADLIETDPVRRALTIALGTRRTTKWS